MINCTEPWARAYAVTTIEAAPTLTPRSAEICGNSESDTRTIDWLAKEASASSVMALVALARETGGVEGKVDSGGFGRLSTALSLTWPFFPAKAGIQRGLWLMILDSRNRRAQARRPSDGYAREWVE